MSPIKHKPTPESRKLVQSLAGFGVPQMGIAREVGISDETLRLYYRDELDSGVEKANAKVAQSLYQKALGDGPQAITAGIFWMKTRARWKEPPQEVAGADGGPLVVQVLRFTDAAD